jgi:hypothetical protein
MIRQAQKRLGPGVAPMVFLCGVVLLGLFAARALLTQPFSSNSPRPPAIALPGQVIEFTTYVDSIFGYRLSVPKDARREFSGDRRQAVFTYQDVQASIGSYLVQVNVVSGPNGTARELLLAETAGVRDPSTVTEFAADGGRLIGASRTYAVEPTTACPSRRAIAAAFLSREGYVIRIASDGTGMCDAEAVPQSRPTIESLRLSE